MLPFYCTPLAAALTHLNSSANGNPAGVLLHFRYQPDSRDRFGSGLRALDRPAAIGPVLVIDVHASVWADHDLL